jgi:TolB protein
MITTRRSFLHGALGGAAGLISLPALAKLEITLGVGDFKPMRIAVMDFEGGARGAEMAKVIAADLKRSGLFEPIAREQFPEASVGFNAAPNFAAWSPLGVQAIVTGQVADGGASMDVLYRLWDIAAGQQADGQQLSTSGKAWRRAAHIVADGVYTQVVGEKGFFDTRIVYVDESGPKNKRRKRLAIMDSDGFGPRALTGAEEIVVTPRFSPNSQTVAYMSFKGETDPRVLLLDVGAGRKQSLGDFPGMTFAPRFSPDGRRVVMSMQTGGDANIFAMDIVTRETTRLTAGAAIDTSPCFSPDGSQIVFESDRGGRQQIYAMSAGGGGAKRISFGEGSYSTPVWSPKGDLIAFTKQQGGEFAIGVMRADGSAERILTKGFHKEGPTWAPNGRYLLYFQDQGGASRIFMTDTAGRVNVQIPTPGSASDPSWSGLLSEVG